MPEFSKISSCQVLYNAKKQREEQYLAREKGGLKNGIIIQSSASFPDPKPEQPPFDSVQALPSEHMWSFNQRLTSTVQTKKGDEHSHKTTDSCGVFKKIKDDYYCP